MCLESSQALGGDKDMANRTTEESREYMRKWRAANPEKYKEYNKKYREANVEHYKGLITA